MTKINEKMFEKQHLKYLEMIEKNQSYSNLLLNNAINKNAIDRERYWFVN